MKLIGKSRIGAKIKKTYDQAKTPWERLQTENVLEEAKKVVLVRFS